MFLRRFALLIMSLLALASAGCGGSEGPSGEGQVDDRSAVEATMKSYFTALADGDGARACSHLTAAARRQVVTQLEMLAPASESASCAQTLGNVAETLGTSTAGQMCGPGADAECERIARKTAKDLIADLKDVELKVEVRGDAATAGPAAGPEGYDGELRKIDGTWLISKFASL